MLAFFVAVVAGLYFGREVVIPIALAVLLSFVLAPLVDLLRRIKLPRVPAVIVAVLLAIGVILALGTAIGTQVAQLAGDLPRYQSTIMDKLSTLRSVTIAPISDVLNRVNREIHASNKNAPSPAQSSPQQRGSAAKNATPERAAPPELRETELSPVALAERVLAPILSPLATMGIVIVVAIFILLQEEDLRDRLIRLFGSSDLHRTTIAMNDAARRLSRYFLTQLGLNTLFGIIIGVGLWLIGVPSPILWGILAMLLRFVPYIGAFIAAIAPVLLAAAVDPGWSMALWTAALFLVTEPIMGQFIEPQVYGHSTGLSPFAVVVAAIFWTWLWGAIGLLLSTPLTLCLVVLGRHVERLEFIDVLLGDRPALTPIENFYQRMLAGDPDEALEHAERLLEERSLSSYYDEVAVRGLQLAASDADRGVVNHQQLERIKDSMTELVKDLAGYDDVDPTPKKSPRNAEADEVIAPTDDRAVPRHPAPTLNAAEMDELPSEWQGEAPILCVAGRGPLDEPASEMLAQLLRKHELGARVVPHEAVSRSSIARLEADGVAMICITYLEISGAPAHLRYLVQRLRQRLPGKPILIGLWPSEDPILVDQTFRNRVGVDYYVSTLREAVESCLQEAMNRARTQSAEAPHEFDINPRSAAGVR
jgi:predicted PurR-regulated permease PerM